MDVYVNGEPAGTWETAVGNSVVTNYEVDVTGIDDMDELEQYMHDHAGAIPYEMVNGNKVYVRFAKLPQNNTSVTIQGIISLVQGTGGYLTGYTGEGFWTKLAKSAVFNAIMRSMYLAIDAATVAPAIQSEIESSLNDFCIVNSNDIPVYVDSNGLAYVLEDAIEAVRDKLIALGAYGDGEPDPEPITDNLNVTSYSSTIADPGTNTVIKDFFNALVTNGYIEDRIPKDISSNNIRYITNNVRLRSGNVATDVDADYLFIYRYDNAILVAHIFSEDTFTSLYPNYANEQVTCVGAMYKYADGTDAGLGSITATNVSIYVDPVTSKKIFLAYGNNPTSNFVRNNPDLFSDIVSGSYNQNTLTVGPARFCNVAYYFMGDNSLGIEGLTVSDVVPVGFGDATLPLDDVLPGWTLRGRSVATPGDDDIWIKSPVLPLDVPLDDVWTDGYAGDSEDVTTGDLEDIIKNAIIAVIPDILADIIDDTDVTADDVYRIPVDDGGDTPPATPPVLDGSSNGLWTMYNPDKEDVNAFGAWLWSDTIIDQIIRQFNSPIDAIIGFHQIYCTPSTGADKVIKAGYLNSPVSAPEVTNQYTTIDCGTVHVDEFYGNVLDYDNSQVSIYLPFVGIVPLNTNLVMGADLNVIYRIDVFTGTCLAQIKVVRENSNAVLYAFDGNCAVQIPLTATTYTGMIGALISGISAGVSFVTGDMLHAATSGISAAMSALNGQTGTKQSGSMGSNAGSLGIRKPYLIITRAISSMPAGFETLSGLPSTELTALSSVSGFTVVRNVHLEGIPGTAEELEEIKSLLESGVIF